MRATIILVADVEHTADAERALTAALDRAAVELAAALELDDEAVGYESITVEDDDDDDELEDEGDDA